MSNEQETSKTDRVLIAAEDISPNYPVFVDKDVIRVALEPDEVEKATAISDEAIPKGEQVVLMPTAGPGQLLRAVIYRTEAAKPAPQRVEVEEAPVNKQVLKLIDDGYEHLGSDEHGTHFFYSPPDGLGKTGAFRLKDNAMQNMGYKFGEKLLRQLTGKIQSKKKK